MLEIAAAPAYKDLLEALGKLAEWTEQAGSGGLPAGPPSADLVRQFNEALNVIPAETATPVAPAATAPDAAQAPGITEPGPSEVIGDAELFQTDGKPVRLADNGPVADDRLFEEQRRDVDTMTEAQEVNMERGLHALDAAADASRPDFFGMARKLSALLSKPAAEISPMDLLQAQRLVGILKVHAESGKKVSEGVSDTLEQLLEQQG